ncbi:MAG: hypothetical protein Q9159_005467 [Coniocarpon cinnabarinum]
MAHFDTVSGDRSSEGDTAPTTSSQQQLDDTPLAKSTSSRGTLVGAVSQAACMYLTLMKVELFEMSEYKRFIRQDNSIISQAMDDPRTTTRDLRKYEDYDKAEFNMEMPKGPGSACRRSTQRDLSNMMFEFCEELQHYQGQASEVDAALKVGLILWTEEHRLAHAKACQIPAWETLLQPGAIKPVPRNEDELTSIPRLVWGLLKEMHEAIESRSDDNESGNQHL